MSTDAPAAGPGSSTPAPAAAQPNPTGARHGADSGRRDCGQAPGVEDVVCRDTTTWFDGQGAEAYDRGHRIFRPGVEAFVSGGEDQRVHIGHQYHYYAGRVGATTPGPVRAEVLETVRDRYVAVDGYPDMLTALRDRRLLLLGGAPATGRSTTALRLLDELGKGDVLRLDAAADLRTLGDDDLQSGRGYLGELTEGGAAFTENHADRLADLLARRDCYLVFVVTPDHMRSEAFHAYGLECLPPDVDALLDRHISAQLTLTDPEDLPDRLTTLAASPELRAALGPSPSVAETVRFAGLLIAHARDELTLQQLEAACGGFVQRQVIEWFGTLPRAARGDAAERAMRLAGFRLALAVFNGTGRGVVAQAGEDLAARLIKTVQPQRNPGRPLFADPDVTLLDASRAQIVQGHVRYTSGSVPVDLICFRDDRYPQAVLSHVWHQHHNMRPPLINWLRKFALDSQNYVWTCAAQAAGVLCWVDFPVTFNDLIEPAARAKPPKYSSEPDVSWDYRWFAAVALDQASRDDRLRTVIDGILRTWRRQGSHAQRCTAALALGYELGHRSVETSLDELRIIGTPEELHDRSPLNKAALDRHRDLVWVAGLSIARLFATGAWHPVLDRLSHWIERREHPERGGRPERTSLYQLALQTVLQMACLRVFSLSEREFAGTRPGGPSFPQHFEERRSWPLLLALPDDDPSLAGPIAHLLRRALRSAVRERFLKELGFWMRATQEDPACLAVLVDWLPSLVEDESDRARLLDLVRRRRFAWADPLHPDVAERLAETLRCATTGTKGHR